MLPRYACCWSGVYQPQKNLKREGQVISFRFRIDETFKQRNSDDIPCSGGRFFLRFLYKWLVDLFDFLIKDHLKVFRGPMA